MTKLDGAINYVDTVFVNAESVTIWDKSIRRLMLIDESKMDDVIRAAQQYAALLKLAPEIETLVDIEELKKEAKWFFKNSIKMPQGSTYTYSTTNLMFLIKFLDHIANTRPTLRAIHDNLTKWGE